MIFFGLFLLATVAGGSSVVLGQVNGAPVYTDDSPEAWQLFSQADDQRRTGNLPEAVRLYQRLLDAFPRRLIRSEDAAGQRAFVNVRSRVHEALRSDESLLDRYREMQDDEAARRLEIGDAERVVMSRFLTAPGLAAGVQVAEARLRRAQFDGAALVLRELRNHSLIEAHPELARRAAALALMVGVYGRDEETWTLGEEWANALNAPELVERWRETRDDFEPPDLAEGVGPRDALEDPRLDSVGRSPVWRYYFDHRERAFGVRPEGGRVDRAQRAANRESGAYLNIFPTVSDHLVLVNDGVNIVALDRYDGRERWRFALYENVDPGWIEALLIDARHTYGVAEPWGVAAQGRFVVAPLKQPDPDRLPHGRTVLNALDRETGEALWSVAPDELDLEFDGAAFVGLPIIHEGRVYSLVRKGVQRLFSDYLVALELDTGALAWRQHVASVGLTPTDNSLLATQPLLREGVLYLSSPLGAIAAVEATTGLTRWLRVAPPEDELVSGERPPAWDFDTVALTEAGLVAPAPDRESFLVLDAATGEVEREISASRWGGPGYLLANADDLFVVGTNITRINANDLDDIDERIVEFEQGERLFGRALIGADRLIVPTNQALRLLDPSSETTTIDRAEIEEPGNPVVIGAEALIATSDGVDSYLPYTVGAPSLRRRLDERPDDPRPAVSLATLAFRHQRYDAITPAVDEAIQIIERDPVSVTNRDAQTRLFATLLDMGADPGLVESDIASEIFRRLDLIARSADQRVAFLLAHGEYLERRRELGAAVDAYQTILQTPALAEQNWSSAARRFRAGVEATRRLRALIDRDGPQVYILYEEAAQRELNATRASSDSATLLDFAARYPLATAAPEAVTLAADELLAANQTAAALATLRRGLGYGPGLDSRRLVVGRLLETLRDRGQSETALNVARRIERESPDFSASSVDGFDRPIAEWVNALETSVLERHRAARLGDISDEPYLRLPGEELLLPEFGRPTPGVALVRDGELVRAHGGLEFDVIWEYDLRTRLATLLTADRMQAILLTHDQRQPRRLVALNLETGEPDWVAEGFDEALSEADQNAARRLAQRLSANLLPSAIGAEEIVLADEDGRIVCVERRTGAIRWVRVESLDTLSHIAFEPTALIIAGQRIVFERNARRVERVIQLLDPSTGTLGSEIRVDADAKIEWIATSDAGELLYAYGDTLVCFDIDEFEQRWQTSGPDLRNTRWPLVAGRTVFFTDGSNTLLQIGLEDGEIERPDRVERVGRDQAPPQFYSYFGSHVLKTMTGVYVFDDGGRPTGRYPSRPDDDINLRSVAIADGRLAVVEATFGSNLASGRGMIIFETDYSGRLIGPNFRPEERTIPKVNAAQAVDDWIVVDSGALIIAVHAPADP
ncbi:MAG: PQQ-binding-like beta-propeller repeat protein [Phycisphaerales bacterium]